MSVNVNVAEIMDLIEGRGYFGVRGISNREIEYLTHGAVLPNSWSHLDDMEETELGGLSTISISSLMYDGEVISCIETALTYSDCGRVILVNGDSEEQGGDPGESIISNARFILEIAIV